jgi:pyrroline-5-carboxylate reductase
MTFSLSFIGGGNMARSLIGGLIARGVDPQRIVVADPLAAQLESLRAAFGVGVTQDNRAAAEKAAVVVLAVKPQEMRKVTSGIADALAADALIVSVAAGIRASDIQQWAKGRQVVRCMPNRPALQGCGMTALYAAQDVTPESRARAEQILSAVGATLWVEDESHMDAVTAVSGSGPAYFFLLIEILEQTGVRLGLSPDVAHRLAVETAYGAGTMAREASESPATLREQVTSKGGTTAAALEHLEAHGVRDIFATAIAAAARRSKELAEQFGSS